MQDKTFAMNKDSDSGQSRKEFMKTLGVAALGVGALATGCAADAGTGADAPGILTGKTYKWNMVTTWPPNFPILGTGCNHFADWVSEMSGGQLQIRVYGGGELIPALEAFDAVSSRTAQIGSGAAYYWAGKSAATQFFGAIPFGLNAQQANAWLYSGGGMALWEEVYAPFDVIPLAGGCTGVQMGGWFNRRIDSMQDLRGLKMRIPGLGGKVLGRAGGTAVLSPGNEIYTNLERGVIDATEWIGPYHDYLMGFHQIADYYYYPGWHEPTAILELFVNKSDFERLPSHLQAIIRTASYRLNLWTLSEFEVRNAEHLAKIKAETDVQILPFPDEVIAGLRQHTNTVIQELIASDPVSAKVHASFQAFKTGMRAWADVTERTFYNLF